PEVLASGQVAPHRVGLLPREVDAREHRRHVRVVHVGLPRRVTRLDRAGLEIRIETQRRPHEGGVEVGEYAVEVESYPHHGGYKATRLRGCEATSPRPTRLQGGA